MRVSPNRVMNAMHAMQGIAKMKMARKQSTYKTAMQAFNESRRNSIPGNATDMQKYERSN